MQAARISLRCTLSNAKSIASWCWEVCSPKLVSGVDTCKRLSIEIDSVRSKQGDHHPPNHETRTSVSQSAADGVGFSVFESSTHELLCAGTPCRIEYEDLRLRRRERSRAHATYQRFKPLPSRMREIISLSLNMASVSTLHPVFSPRTLRRVNQISCGVSHCIALIASTDTSSDALFAWGIGIYGQLGLGEQQRADTMAPVHVTAQLQDRIRSTEATGLTKVRCGPFASYVFFENTSDMWHWGLLPSGVDGDNSTDKFVLQGVPAPFLMVEDGVELIDVAAGLEHVILLSASGQVYSWGYGLHGQLGLGHGRIKVVNQCAQRVDFFHTSHVSIRAISCGWHHTLALTSGAVVYAWGSNRFGACGAATKFHEYFLPVSVALPLLPALQLCGDGTDTDATRCLISCSGDTSVLTIRLRSTGTFAAVFAWGVCSVTASALTPFEVSGVQWHTRLTDCRAGMGALQWSYEAGSANREQCCRHCPPLLQIQPEKFPSHKVLQVGEVLVLRLSRIGCNDCVCHERLHHDELIVRHIPSSFLQDVECKSLGQIMQLIGVGSSSDGSSNDFEVILQATAAGDSGILLSYAGTPVLGSPVQVRVQPQEQEHEGRDPTTSCNHHQCAIVHAASIIAEKTQDSLHLQPLSLADLRWTPTSANRVRICANDTLVLLIESKHCAIEHRIQVLSMFGSSIDAEVCYLGVVADIQQRRQMICATVRVSQIGAFTVASTGLTTTGLGSTPEQFGRSVKLLELVCLMGPVQRFRLLEANAGFIERHMLGSSAATDADIKSDRASIRARFSAFISILLEKKALRDVVANTPLSSTADVERAVDWDFDCEEENRLLLCSRQEDPFVLWRTSLCPMQEMNSLNQRQARGHCGFWDVMPRWTANTPATIDLSLVVVRAQGVDVNSGDAFVDESSADLSNAAGKTREVSSRTEVRVHQNPHEFLVSGPSNFDIENTALSSDNGEHGHLTVTAWRDQHGELFYTTQTSNARNYAVVVYGHESHSFRESATGNLVGRRKSQLHAFLWELLDTQQREGIEGLFRSFLPSTTASGWSVRDPDHHHIRICDFISTLENLGFPSAGVSKQEWLTLFMEIQRLAPTASDERMISAKVTCGVFKTFLLDPYHLLFWRQYIDILHSYTALSNDSDVDMQSLLLEHFRPSMRSEDQANHSQKRWSVPWSEFLEYLDNFHLSINLRSPMRTGHSATASSPPLISSSDCCRLLYRFDISCNGYISVNMFIERVICALRERIRSACSSPSTQRSKSKPTLAGAVRSAKRPDVDAFSTPSAVQKLFRARANQLHEGGTKVTAVSARRSLVIAGNTHLARIRSLPVSKLLREGVSFRPQLHASASASEIEAAEQLY